MRFVAPPTDSPARGRSGDDLDGLLGAFFRAEMPQPWPAAPEVEEPAALPMPRRTRSLLRSRLVLAASVAFLLAIPWMIADSFKTLKRDSTDLTIGPGNASRNLRFETTLEQQPNGETGIKLKMKFDDMLP